MAAELARQRYLQRHIEPGLPARPTNAEPWRNVLVIPAYRESASLLQHLAGLSADTGRSLVIIVLNRPDSDPDANAELRNAAALLKDHHLPPGGPVIQQLNPNTDLYLYDQDKLSGPIPASRGVGLARKTGCDIAFKWISQGAIDSTWIYCSDADAQLPQDYFSRLDTSSPQTVAAVYPFYHAPGEDEACNNATSLYELRLHHYVLGLEHAVSPYAFHSLGSCLAVRADSYAQVRGFPQRAGGEDFYLLNKLAKLGAITKLEGECISLQSRHSSRAPFGTGPAVEKISAALEATGSTAQATKTMPHKAPQKTPKELPLFYHPACFEALRCLLAAIPTLRQAPGARPLSDDLPHALTGALAGKGLADPLLPACAETIIAMGLAGALEHCHRQGKSPEQFMRQFHQWFDGFRTLKFIHGIRDAGWPLQPLQSLLSLEPRIWPPADTSMQVETLRTAARKHWGWAR